MDIFSLLKLIIEDQNLNYTIIESFDEKAELFDLGLRKEILIDYNFSNFWRALLSHYSDDTLLFFQDTFQCNYAIFRYSSDLQENNQYILIGPFLTKEMTKSNLYHLQQIFDFSTAVEQELREYYNSIPKIYESNRFYTLLSTLTKQLLNKALHVKFVENIFEMDTEKLEYISESPLYMSYKLIEKRYQVENDILEAIAQGNFSKAQSAKEQFIQYQITPRYKDPVRNLKNLLIVFNTLCRKTVEGSNVHPFHIDEISKNFAIQIESLQSLEDVSKLQIAMTRKYCLLVNNYSLSGYSPVIQKAINHIDMNISETISLNKLADLLTINASYLSTLFKKELGITVTEYIHSQKIQFAIKLLNKTDMQIQNIAAAIGINDVNYFIKTFKKVNGMTPKEYRDSIKVRREIEKGSK